MKNDDTNICVYCGVPDAKTKDHIPPKGIFAHPRPNNLITVPCCEECHRDTSTDDEYFRNMLTMRHNTHEHPDVQGILEKVFRSYKKPEKKRTFNSLLRTIKEVELKTPSGIYLKNASTYDVDNVRLDRVVERIVRGLYWHERNHIYPLQGRVKSYSVDSMGLTNAMAEKINRMLTNAEEKVIGQSTFKYRMARSSEEHFELWLLTFYEKVQFLVFLNPLVKE